MPKLIFIEHNGTAHEVAASSGFSVMQAAVANGVLGIIAECGGNCACATCHVYVDPAWRGRIGEPTASEKEMIECAMYVEEGSRLSCQIEVTDQLDGLRLRLPPSQT